MAGGDANNFSGGAVEINPDKASHVKKIKLHSGVHVVLHRNYPSAGGRDYQILSPVSRQP
jgi:hypothetical protein